MDLGINGKSALVLGAGGGLGGAIAKALAREGARVALADIASDAVERTVEDIRNEGGTALGLTWDLGDLSAIDDNVRTIEDAFGSVDILVNNTGGPPPTPAAGQDQELWSKSFQSMVLSVIALTDRVLPGMRAEEVGPHHHQHLFGRGGPHPQSRHFERAAAVARRLVEDAGARGWPRWHHRQHRPARSHRHAAHHLPRRAEGEARGPCCEGRNGRKRRLDSRSAAMASPKNTVTSSRSWPAQRAAYLTGGVIRVDGGLIASI